MGGAAFTFSMLWAQLMPFVALQLYDDDGSVEDVVGAFSKETFQIFLMCSLGAWVLTMVAFFSSINLSYVNTFFGFTTGSQFTCNAFHYASDDCRKFTAAFKRRASHTKSIREEIKTWVADNIDKWKVEDENWFNIDLIPDEMLPSEYLDVEGGAQRRRSTNVSLREAIGLTSIDNSSKVHPEKTSKGFESEHQQDELLNLLEGRKRSSATIVQKKKDLRDIAEKMYAAKKNNYKRNHVAVKKIIEDNDELFAPLLKRCPKFNIILTFLLEERFGARVGRVKTTTKIADLSYDDCRIVGSSFATFLRKRTTGAAALDDWRRQYIQLEVLFTEVEGFEGFMLVLAKNFSRDR